MSVPFSFYKCKNSVNSSGENPESIISFLKYVYFYNLSLSVDIKIYYFFLNIKILTILYIINFINIRQLIFVKLFMVNFWFLSIKYLIIK